MPTWTSQNSGALLLALIGLLFLYLVPAIIAFLRGHRRFWFILAVNLVAAPLQTALLQGLFPPLVTLETLPRLGVSLVLLLGPLWLAALVWSLLPVRDPDPRLLAARNTKAFDFAAALPLMIWFGNSALQLRPVLVQDFTLIRMGAGSVFVWLQFLSLLFSALFCLLTVWLLVVRDKPVLRARGALPRICAVAGTFLGVGMLRLPVAELSLPVQFLAFVLTGGGSLASMLVLARLGRSFSIVPEARRLVTSGPYAFARHPLYAAEMITIIGSAIQYAQPWAGLVGAGVIALQVIRSLYEEQVLAQAFPEYEAYQARTKRFIPGIV